MGFNNSTSAGDRPSQMRTSNRLSRPGHLQAVDPRPDAGPEAEELMSDLAALVDAGLVVVCNDPGGQPRYAVAAGFG